MRKETVVAYFKIIEGLKKTIKTLNKDSWSRCREMKLGLPPHEYEAGQLTARSVDYVENGEKNTSEISSSIWS